MLTLSCPSGGRLSTSPRSAWACCTACMLLFMVPMRACWARLWWRTHGTRDRVMHTPCYLTVKLNMGTLELQSWSYNEHLTSGGMCPLCIWPIMICCCGAGMVPMLKVSGPPTEPERMMPGSATDPCSTLPTRLNCCCRIVDLHTCKHQTHAFLCIEHTDPNIFLATQKQATIIKRH